MNLDLLMKLTRLANNNPNDNEANLAARRVCKMLEEGKWALSNGGPKEPQFSNPYEEDFFSMYMRMKAERDRRYAEAAQREHQRERERAYTAGEKAKEAQYSHVYDDYNPFTQGGNYGTWNDVHRSEEPFWQSKQSKYTSASEQSKNKEARNLVCKWCRQTKSTKFVGLPELFVCNTCQWTAYQKDKK